MIACIAIVGPKNNPLHIQPTLEDASKAPKFDYITFVGLDAVDNILREHKEKKQSFQTSQGTENENQDKQFLGLVSITPEYHIYAYVMANLAKLMVLVSSVAKPAHPKFLEEIAKLCTKIERAYKRAVSNPFIVPGSSLDSKNFSESCQRLFKDFESTNW